MARIEDRHLGDGVYAKDMGDGIVQLDLRGQDQTTFIVLEPEVFAELLSFAIAANPMLATIVARKSSESTNRR